MKVAFGRVMSGSYRDFIPREFVQSMEPLLRDVFRGRTPITGFGTIDSMDFPTDAARNEVCQQALEGDFDRLVFLDLDQTFTVESVMRLVESEHDIITGRYHIKQPSYHPNLYVKHRDAPEGRFKPVHYGRGVFPIDRCGAGALAISRKALEAIGSPWFQYQDSKQPPFRRNVSEDFWFCQRAQEEGFTIWADWDATFGHIASVAITGDWRDAYMEQFEESIQKGEVDPEGKVIACGFPEGYRLPSGHVIRDHACTDSL